MIFMQGLIINLLLLSSKTISGLNLGLQMQYAWVDSCKSLAVINYFSSYFKTVEFKGIYIGGFDLLLYWSIIQDKLYIFQSSRNILIHFQFSY